MEYFNIGEDCTNEENLEDEIELLQLQRRVSSSESESQSASESSVSESGTPQKRKSEQITENELKRKKIENRRNGSALKNVAKNLEISAGVKSAESLTEFHAYSTIGLEHSYSLKGDSVFPGEMSSGTEKSLPNKATEFRDDNTHFIRVSVIQKSISKNHEVKKPCKKGTKDCKIQLSEIEDALSISRASTHHQVNHDHVYAFSTRKTKENLPNSLSTQDEPTMKFVLDSTNESIIVQPELFYEQGEPSKENKMNRRTELSLSSEDKTTKLVDNNDINAPLQVNANRSEINSSAVLQDSANDSCNLTPRNTEFPELNMAWEAPRKKKHKPQRDFSETLCDSPVFAENENANISNSISTTGNTLKQNFDKKQLCIVRNKQIDENFPGKSLEAQNIEKNIKSEVDAHSRNPSPEQKKTANSGSRSETFSNGKTFQEILDEFKSGNHERGESSRDESLQFDFPDLCFKEYPGLVDDPTKVKKDARFQKKFYKQTPVILRADWGKVAEVIDQDLAMNQSRIDEPDDQVQILEEHPPSNLNIPQEQNQKSPSQDESYPPYPKLVPIAELPNASNSTRYRRNSCTEENETISDPRLRVARNKEQKLNSEDDLPYPGVIPLSSLLNRDDPSGYKVSSFMEESPNSTHPSNSPEEWDQTLEEFRPLDEKTSQLSKKMSSSLTIDTDLGVPQYENEVNNSIENSLDKHSNSKSDCEPVFWVSAMDDNSLQKPPASLENVLLEQQLSLRLDLEETMVNLEGMECTLSNDDEHIGVIGNESGEESDSNIESRMENKVVTEKLSDRSVIRTRVDKASPKNFKDIS